MLKKPAKRLRLITAVAIAALTTLAISVANAATGNESIDLIETDGLVVVSGKGFPAAEPVTVTATLEGGRGEHSISSSSNGRFLLAFEPPATFTGSVTIDAVSGKASATSTLSFGRNTSTSPVIKPPATPIDPKSPPTSATAAPLPAEKPTGQPIASGDNFLYFTAEDLSSLPQSGAGWEYVKAMGSADPGPLNLGNMDEFKAPQLIAAAILHRTGSGGIGYDAILTRVKEAMGTEANAASPKDFYRHTAAFLTVIEVAGIPHDTVGANGQSIEAWVESLLDKKISNKHPPCDTIRKCSEVAGHNFGAYARAARIARAMFLGDQAEIDAVNALQRRWLGDTSFPNTFVPSGDFAPGLAVKAYPADQGVISPPSSDSRNGVNVEDGGRGLDSSGMPIGAGVSYQEGSFEASMSTMVMLWHAGHTNIFTTAENALLRNAQSTNMNWSAAASNRQHLPWMMNYIYGSSLPTQAERMPGHSIGYGQWLTSGSTWLK